MGERQERKVVLVLGMHRSGTSAIGGALSALGVQLGHTPGHNSEENPKGYFENQAIVQLNEQILKHLGYSWSNPFWGGEYLQVDKVEKFFPLAVNLLREHYDDFNVIGVKDPRICLLLPFWERVIEAAFDSKTYFVHALRHPLEVADSLEVRRSNYNKFVLGDIRQSLLLWFSHHYCAVRSLSHDRNILVHFEDLIQDPEKQLSRLIDFLQIPPDKSTVTKYLETFLNKGLKHHSFKFEILQENYPDLFFVSDLYRGLCQFRSHNCFTVEDISSLMKRLPALEVFQACCKTAFPVFQEAMMASELRQYTNDLTKQIRFEANELSVQKKQSQDLQRELSRQEERSKLLERELYRAQYALNYHKIITTRVTEGFTWKTVKKVNSLLKKIPGSSSLVGIFLAFLNDKEVKNNHKILSGSGLFDPDFYLEQLSGKKTSGQDLLTHFLTKGSAEGLKPNPYFDPDFYYKMYPDVAANGLNPLVHYYLQGRKEGRITETGLNTAHGRNLSSGKDQGTVFDPDFYRKVYYDIGDLDPLFHYNLIGRREGRLPSADTIIVEDHSSKVDPAKENVLIVSHDASATGGPLLCLEIIDYLKKNYNVIAFLINGGAKENDFIERSDVTIKSPFGGNQKLLEFLLKQLTEKLHLKFAIVNTIQSRSVLPGLARCFVPSICLIHEFCSYIQPRHAINEAVKWSSEVVFSAQCVWEDATRYSHALAQRNQLILPQGQRTVKEAFADNPAHENAAIYRKTRPDHLSKETVVVLGAGTVELRKGVDLFVKCAGRLKAIGTDVPFHFVWAGQGFNPDNDKEFSSFLKDQIEKEELEGCVSLVGQLPNLMSAYEAADIFFLSSRLDPLPNVAIDAMFAGLPVVCFEKTGGIPEFLKNEGFHQKCVFPYLEVDDMAMGLRDLINDATKRKSLGDKLRKVAGTFFNMQSYVESLIKLGREKASFLEREKNDCLIIEKDTCFQKHYYSHSSQVEMDHRDSIREFVRSWRSGEALRKPFPGFHPGIYAEANHLNLEEDNPLAHYISLGYPVGPWKVDLIKGSGSSPASYQCTIALHIHVFYEDLFESIYEKLDDQDLALDLLISVPNQSMASRLSNRLQSYRKGRVDIRVVPNRGRDLGPLITEFGDEIVENYELIGHVHTKKSMDLGGGEIIDKWFSFLLENLLGTSKPMASTIISEFVADQSLGLVFPCDPYCVGWSQNRNKALKLLERLSIENLPNQFFDFPVGNMFWARSKALKALLCANFSWNDYPGEPVSYDGTTLHAIERLLPTIVMEAGYSYKMTHVENILR